MFTPYLTITIAIAAVAGMLASEARWPRWEWLFKPLASLCFITLALQAGAIHSSYGQWLLAGLVLCLFGDVFLIPHDEKSFRAGLTSFLLGHLLYAVAFLQLPLNLIAMLWGLIPVTLLAVLSLRWLWPHVPSAMQVPVLAYIGVICCMLLMAGSTWGSASGALILAGAWGFAVSDLSVARHQFVKSDFRNRLWGIPLYFGSQMLLAWSVAGVAS
ncbi:MAG: lysoplasmalogenase [Halieaceae bacterium]